jgi:hypothetical protein
MQKKEHHLKKVVKKPPDNFLKYVLVLLELNLRKLSGG